MKINFKIPIVVLALLLTAASCSTTQRVYAQENDPLYDNGYNNNNDYNNNDQQDEPLINPGGDVTFDQFYNDLSPYGRWIDNPQYGRVWIYNEPGFRPYYSGGHWAYTNFGWTWVSDYSWGWAPFHYGRWSYDPSYGWFWVPGYHWGPAWVNWRRGSEYYGWAPMGPGVNININFGLPASWWVFVPHRYINYPYFTRYCVNPRRNTYIIHNTTIINNTNIYNNHRYVTGPDRREVERYTGGNIRPVPVREVVRVTPNNSGNISRPERNGNAGYNRSNISNQRSINNNQRPESLTDNNTTGGNADRRGNVQFKPIDRSPRPPVSAPANNSVNNNAVTPPAQPDNTGNRNTNDNNSSEWLRRNRMMNEQRNRQSVPQQQAPSRMYRPQVQQQNTNQNNIRTDRFNQPMMQRQIQRQQQQQQRPSFQNYQNRQNSNNNLPQKQFQQRVQRKNG